MRKNKDFLKLHFVQWIFETFSLDVEALNVNIIVFKKPELQMNKWTLKSFETVEYTLQEIISTNIPSTTSYKKIFEMLIHCAFL